MLKEAPLTEEEWATLERSGWRAAGGGRAPDGRIWLYLRAPSSPPGSAPQRMTRVEIRAMIAGIRAAQERRAAAAADLLGAALALAGRLRAQGVTVHDPATAALLAAAAAYHLAHEGPATGEALAPTSVPGDEPGTGAG